VRREETPAAGPRDLPALWRVLSDLAATAALLWERGWAEGNAGNLSCDVTDLVPESAATSSATPVLPGAAFGELAGRRLLVTAAGSRMRDLAREPDLGCGILQMSDSGAGFVVAWRGTAGAAFAPTSELPSHLAIHAALRRRRSAHLAVVHSHPTELLALSHDPRLADEARLARTLWTMHPEVVVAVPAGVALVPCAMPGTAAQGAAAGAAMERHDVALWAKHGAVAVGVDFAGAFDLLDTVNKAARMLLLGRAAGYEPEGLSDAEIEELRRAYPGPGAS
jgi:rhamnulose-1-phosphate aldolase